MFGREAELVEVDRLLDSVQAGPATLGLEGEPGVGKSTLWQAALQRARERGYRVLVSAPAEPDVTLSFAGLGDLLDEIPEGALDALPSPQARALRSALSLDEPDPGAAHAASRGLLYLLRLLAAETPTLVAIDDEQWLDGDSARLLAFALTRRKEERLAVLVARRLQTGGALWAELTHAGMTTVSIGPLSREALHELIEEQVQLRLTRAGLDHILERSGGNPLYALEIARSGSDAPPTLSGAIGRRLERLGPDAAQPLLAIAALRHPSLSRLRTAGMDVAALDVAERARVVDVRGDRVRFTHPLLASVHYQRAPAGQRRVLHRRLAAVVDDEQERAHHLALAADAPDEALAAELEQAARNAAARGATATAAGLSEHAARLSPDVAAQAARTVAAAERHFAASDLVRVRAMLVDLALEPGPLRARANLLLARSGADDLAASAAYFDQALADAGDDHRLRSEIEQLLSERCLNLGDAAGARQHGRLAIEEAARAGDGGLLATALAEDATTAFFGGEGVDDDAMSRAIALEARIEDIDTYYLPSTKLGLMRLWSDDLSGARGLLEAAVDHAVRAGRDGSRGSLSFHLAHLSWLGDDLAAARRATARCGHEARQVCDEQLDGYVLWLTAFSAYRLGRLDEAIGHAETTIAHAQHTGDVLISFAATVVIACADVVAGRPASALERLAPDSPLEMVGSFVLDGWVCRAEALIALDRRDEAEAEIDAIEARGRTAGNPLAEALAWRLRGQLHQDPEAFQHALEAHTRRPVAFELGRTLLERGTVERRLRRKAAAKRSLEEAERVLEPLEASVWLARARDELGRIGLRRPAAEGLTGAQRRVAELVSEGLTNREIAAVMFMSVRTVESHLTRVYGEYGVSSRSRLTAALRHAGD